MEAKKKPGVKPRGPYSDKRKTLTTRITESTRDALDAAAVAAGRSLSQEIEFRLEQSFRGDQSQYEQFGGKIAYKLMRVLAAGADSLATTRGKDWLFDEGVFDEAMAIWLAFLSTIRPKPLAPTGAAIGSVRSFAATLEVNGPERAAKMLEHLATEVRGRSPEHLDSVIEEAYERSARRPRGR